MPCVLTNDDIARVKNIDFLIIIHQEGHERIAVGILDNQNLFAIFLIRHNLGERRISLDKGEIFIIRPNFCRNDRQMVPILHCCVIIIFTVRLTPRQKVFEIIRVILQNIRMV